MEEVVHSLAKYFQQHLEACYSIVVRRRSHLDFVFLSYCFCRAIGLDTARRLFLRLSSTVIARILVGLVIRGFPHLSPPSTLTKQRSFIKYFLNFCLLT